MVSTPAIAGVAAAERRGLFVTHTNASLNAHCEEPVVFI